MVGLVSFLASYVVEFAGSLASLVIEFAGGVANRVAGRAGAVAQWVAGLGGSAASVVAGLAGGVVNVIAGLVGGTVNVIAGLVYVVVDGVSGRASSVASSATERANSVSGYLAAASPRRQFAIGALAVVTLVGSVVAGCAATSGSKPTTAKVVRGSVTKTVSATGTLQAITEQNLGFPTSGKLVSLTVSVGQRVEAGQELARIDDFDAQTDLASAQAKLARERARLGAIQDSKKADAAAHDYDRAKDLLGANQDEADAVDEANEKAIADTRKRLQHDREELAEIRQEAAADKARCNRSVTGGSNRYDGYGDNTDVATRDHRGLLLESPLDLHSPSCNRADRGKEMVASYQRRIDDEQRELQSLQRRAEVDRARGDTQVASARREASAAGDSADDEEAERPHLIDEQQAEVDEAATEVRKAQRAVDDTVLRAPVAGTVASINGVMGEYVGAATGTTPLAPGGRAALPNMDNGAGGKDDTGEKGQRPGGSSFITLKDVNSYQIVVPFEEADAAQVEPNQAVQVTFDAVQGLTVEGTVAALAPTGTKINNVTNYYATILLNQVDPRLKTGQTAEAKVVTANVDNVLVVPTASVQRGAGGAGVVQVVDAHGVPHPVQVQIGLVGDKTTQVLDGLHEGQQVQLAQ
jgi:HlyD family secretion protein